MSKEIEKFEKEFGIVTYAGSTKVANRYIVKAHQKEMEAVVGEIKEEVDNWDWDIDPTYCKNIKRNIDKIAQKHNINIK